MGNFLSLVQFFIEIKDKSINIIILLLFAAFYVLIARYKKNLWTHIKHKRNIWKFLILVLFLIVTLFSYDHYLLVGGWFVFVLFLLGLYVYAYILSLKPKMFSNFRIFKEVTNIYC